MSRVKTSVFIIGLVAVVAVAFVGASSYVASSSRDCGALSAGCGGQDEARVAAPHGDRACGVQTKSSLSCPSARTSSADGKGCAVSAGCPMSKSGCSKTCGSKSTKTAKIEPIGDREGKAVVLAGRFVCGTCELGVGGNGECQPAFRTKDGKNYLLSKNNLSDRLRADARGKDVEIVSRVTKRDGVKYLEVEAIRGAS